MSAQPCVCVAASCKRWPAHIERLTGYPCSPDFIHPAQQGDGGRDWIDDLPGITQINDVHFGELMVPVSAIRLRFAALKADQSEVEKP